LRKEPQKIEDVPAIDRVPVVGYMGFRATYRYPTKQLKDIQKRSRRNVNDRNWETLRPGFQKVLVK